MRYIVYLLVCLLLGTEACKPPRCTIPNCYVRLKHRHGGENWKAAEAPAEFDPDFNASANRGQEYRGVRWWKKNKNPKIGEGYKPGYKYDYKKPKYKKPRKKKSRPEEQPATGEEQITDGQTQSPDSTSVQPEKKKGLFGKLRSKKSKKATEEEQPVEETEQEEKHDKKTEEKDGF